MDSTFIYPVTIHRGAATGSLTANWVASLPASMSTSDERVAVLYSSEGKFPQGLYLKVSNSSTWRFVIPYSAICLGIIDGSAINVFYAVTNPNSGLPSTSKIWRNGTETDNPIFTVNDNAVYGALYPAFGNGEVVSVNGALPDSAGNVKIPIATNTVAGTVKGGGNITIAPDGTLAAPITSVSGQVGVVVVAATNNNAASGTTIISDSGATTGNIKLKTIVAGTNIGVAADANGNIQVNNAYALPVASTTVLGGVKQGANITIAGDGTISGAAPYVLPVATATVLGGVKQGANVAIAGDGTLSVAAPYVLPIATTTVLGGVKQGAGVVIAGDGTISANVLSVNGHQGAVVLSAADITTGTFIPGVIGATPGNNDVLITNAAGVPTWVSTIPTINLPASILGAVDYQGTFIPGTTTLPAAAAANKGWYFVASSAGTYTPPSGTLLTFAAGDWLISNGTAWSTVSTQGAVTSVSGQTGAVVVQAVDNNNATGTSVISNSGATTSTIKLKTIVGGSNVTLANDVNGNIVVNAASYVLPIATAAVLGGVKIGSNVTVAGDGTISVAAPYVLPVATAATLGGVKQGSNVTIAGDGTISVAFPVTSVSGLTGAVVVQASDNNTATGTSVIANSGATTGNIKLLRLVAGTNMALATDGSGNIVINSTATAGALTAVNSEGTGTSLVDNNGTSGGIATIKSLAAGSNITITPAGDGKTLTITANQTITPATTTAIGGVIVKAGLAVDASGNLSLAAPTGVNLGGVKAGTGISIAADGTISVTAVGGVTSVSGQTGAVVVQATDTSTASGTSLITDSGSTTANVKIRRLVAGSGITLATDGNNNLQINSTATGGVSSITAGTSGALTGAITFAAGQSISFSNTGNTVQINGTGVPEAPNDGNLYGRQNMGWTIIPSNSNPITAVNGQAGTGAVLLVEASPPANTAVIKSLVAGSNVTLTENAGLITVTAAIPGGTVATVNSKAPDGSGNVTLTASDVSALPIAGGSMTGDINTAGHKVTGLPTPTVASDAVPLSYITGLVIDGGVIG